MITWVFTLHNFSRLIKKNCLKLFLEPQWSSVFFFCSLSECPKLYTFLERALPIERKKVYCLPIYLWLEWKKDFFGNGFGTNPSRRKVEPLKMFAFPLFFECDLRTWVQFRFVFIFWGKCWKLGEISCRKFTSVSETAFFYSSLFFPRGLFYLWLCIIFLCRLHISSPMVFMRSDFFSV